MIENEIKIGLHACKIKVPLYAYKCYDYYNSGKYSLSMWRIFLNKRHLLKRRNNLRNIVGNRCSTFVVFLAIYFQKYARRRLMRVTILYASVWRCSSRWNIVTEIHEHETKEIFKHANKFAFFLMCCFNLLNASLFVTHSDYICSLESDSFFFSFYHFDDRVLCAW